MSRDGELPQQFEKLNPFGVPNAGLIVATVIPAVLVDSGQRCLRASRPLCGRRRWRHCDKSGRLFDGQKLGLKTLGTDVDVLHVHRHGGNRSLPLHRQTQCSAVCRHHSRFWPYPSRSGDRESREKGPQCRRGQWRQKSGRASASCLSTRALSETTGPPMLCAVRGIGRTLDFAIQEAKDTDRPLYVLFVREQPVIAPDDRKRKWVEDDEARAIFLYAKEKASGHRLLPAYAISDSAADTIVDIAATVGASYLIVGAPQRNTLVNLLRGNIIRNISEHPARRDSSSGLRLRLRPA